MAVVLTAADYAKLSPAARAQLGGNRATSTAPPKAASKAAPQPSTARPPGNPTPQRTGKPGPVYGTRASAVTGGASERTRMAATRTREVWRASGSGRVGTSARGVVWAFVWVGVFGYLLAHPATLPRVVQLVFAPVNGVLQVAHGKNVNLAQHPAT